MPVFVRYKGWYVYFWTNENDEPIHFHIVEGKLAENATKIRVLSTDSFRLANNNSQVAPKILRHILAVMQASIVNIKPSGSNTKRLFGILIVE